MRAMSKASILNTAAAIASAFALVLASTLVILICAGQARAQDPKLTDFPFFVNCQVGDNQRVFYLSTVSADGIAVYISPDQQAGFITATGVGQPISGDASGDCGGKTLANLRDSGQAFDLQR